MLSKPQHICANDVTCASQGFQVFGFGDGGFQMSFGIGAFPFGIFATAFNINDGRPPPGIFSTFSIKLSLRSAKSNNCCWSPPNQRPRGLPSTWTSSFCVTSSCLSPWWSCFGCWLHKRTEKQLPALSGKNRQTPSHIVWLIVNLYFK